MLIAIGCDENPGPAFDLAAPNDSAVDLSVDLSHGKVNLEAACAGTPLAGTCVLRFFQPFADCFQPYGRCGEFGRGSSCWESGASYELAYPGVSSTWSMNGQQCLSWNEVVGTDHQQYCTSETSPCSIDHTVDDGGLFHYFSVGGALYDSHTGIFTCPDGTPVDLGGSEFGGCKALNDLLFGGCDRGDLTCH